MVGLQYVFIGLGWFIFFIYIALCVAPITGATNFYIQLFEVQCQKCTSIKINL